MKHKKAIGMAVLALLVLIVVIQNTEVVETKILFFSLSAPLAVMLLSVLVVGFALGVGVSVWKSSKNS